MPFTFGMAFYDRTYELPALEEHWRSPGALAPDGPAPELYFFARQGFDARLVLDAEEDRLVHLVTHEELV